MAYTLDAAMMQYGEFYDKSTLWDYKMSETRRRITSVTTNRGTSSGTITFWLATSALSVANPFAATTSTQTDKVKIANFSGLNGTYPVASVGTNSVTIKVSLSLIDSGPFNPTLQSRAIRVTKDGLNKIETRKPGKLTWNRNLKGSNAPFPMYDMQYQMYDMLLQFWNDAEVVLEWKAKYSANRSAWDVEKGPTWDFFGGKLFDRSVMLKWWMSTVYSESSWKATSYGLGSEYLTKVQTTGNYDSWPTSGLPCGLWQIGARSAATWWKSSTETASQFALKSDFQDVSRGFNPEYNTRAAIWIMYQLLFGTDIKPFAYWGASNYNNIKMKACYDQSPTNYTQVGNTTIVCEDFKK